MILVSYLICLLPLLVFFSSVRAMVWRARLAECGITSCHMACKGMKAFLNSYRRFLRFNKVQPYYEKQTPKKTLRSTLETVQLDFWQGLTSKRLWHSCKRVYMVTQGNLCLNIVNAFPYTNLQYSFQVVPYFHGTPVIHALRSISNPIKSNRPQQDIWFEIWHRCIESYLQGCECLAKCHWTASTKYNHVMFWETNSNKYFV